MPRKTRKQTKSKNPVQTFASKIKAPQGLKTMGKKLRGIEPETVAKGAAAVSIAAGVIAAGVMLSKKSNRQKAGRIAAKGIKIARKMADEMGNEAEDKSRAIAQSVPIKKNQGSKKKK